MQTSHEKTKSSSKITFREANESFTTSLLVVKHFKKRIKNFANEQVGVLIADKMGRNVEQLSTKALKVL